MPRTATCACGQLTARCRGEPLKVSLCHCTQCQKRTGSAFGVAAFFARDDVAIDGQWNTFVRESDSGHEVAFHFCPECGSTVLWEPSRKRDLVAVAVGAFADPSFPAPSQAVHDENRCSWVSLEI